MSDFLTRIASRELGVAPVVQPVVGSRYAPAADLVAPSNLTAVTSRTKITASPTSNLMPNETIGPVGRTAVGESLPASSSLPSLASWATDDVGSPRSSPLLDEVDTIAQPFAAQPADTDLNFQTPDAIAERAETGERSRADVRESALTPELATPLREASEEASEEPGAFIVGEQKTVHADFEEPLAIKEVGAITEHESVIAEREVEIAQRETLIAEHEHGAPDSATASPEHSHDLKSRGDPQGRADRQGRADLRIIGEPARPSSSDAEFESEQEETETFADAFPSPGEPATEARPSQVRSARAAPPLVAAHQEEPSEEIVDVKTTSPRGREAIVSRPIARRGEGASQSTNASEATSVSEPTVEFSASSPRPGASVPASSRAEDVGREPATGPPSASPPARASVDSRATATRREKTRERTANARGPHVQSDVVSRTVPGGEEHAPPPTTEVRPPVVEVTPASPKRRAAVDSPAIPRPEVARPQPAIIPQPASQPRQDALSSRASAAVDVRATTTPEPRLVAKNSSSPNNDQRRARSTISLASEAIDQERPHEKKRTPDARSLQNRTRSTRDHSALSQSMLMAAERPLGSSRSASEPRAATEKIIRVSIGRIEVHAAQPPPLPVEPPAPPVPKLSLDEFLRQHDRQQNGGRK